MSDSPQFDDEELINQSIAVIFEESRASVSLLQRRLRFGYGRAARIIAELEKRGVVGPANGIEARAVLIKKPEIPKSTEQLLDDDIARWMEQVQRTQRLTFNFVDLEIAFGLERARELLAGMRERDLVLPANNEGIVRLYSKPAATVQFVGSTVTAAAPPAKIGGEDGYAALQYFYSLTNLSPRDEESLFNGMR